MQALVKDAPKELRPSDRTGGSRELLAVLEGARVLLAEDNEINQQVAREILSGAGLEVTVVSNGREAVDVLATSRFDAVLMDVQMPVMDGYTATRLIRADPRFAALPVIAMTAHAMTGDEEKSAAAGMNDHVTKPIDPDGLFETLAKWIGATKGGGKGAAPAQAFPPALDGFELAEGLKRLGGNRELYRRLLADFAGRYIDAAEEIRRSLDAGEFDEARLRVHDIKGLAGNLAANRLQAAAAKVELLLKGAGESAPPAPEKLQETMAELEAQLERALSAARSVAPPEAGGGREATAAAGAGGGLSAEVAREAAQRLREAAGLGDFSALAGISREMVALSPGFAPYQRRIARLADAFDLDGVLALADALEATTK
jgi:CheY-like chemotaxis protein/HPt (histidine-containing phosphotransfer) domain-containing protein